MDKPQIYRGHNLIHVRTKETGKALCSAYQLDGLPDTPWRVMVRWNGTMQREADTVNASDVRVVEGEVAEVAS